MRDAVIFDMDGLLLDTERLSLEAYQKTCEQFDLAYDQDLYFSLVGCNMQKCRDILSGALIHLPLDDFFNVWNESYAKEALDKPVPLKSGVLSLLNHLTYLDIPCGIATSTDFDKATRKLTNAGIIGYFKIFATGDQVRNSKPDPEIYLLAAERLGFKPETCLALEDSDNGVRAAHAANMTVFQIPDLVPPSGAVKSLGHRIISSLTEVEPLFRS